VIVEFTAIGLSVWRREQARQPWTADTIAEHQALPLPEIGVEIPIAEVYWQIEFGLES